MNRVKNIVFAYSGFLFALSQEISHYKLQFLSLIMLNALGSIFGVSVAIASKNLIDSAVAVNFNGVVYAAVFFVALILGNMIIGAIGSVLSVKMTESMSNDIRKRYYDQLTKTSWLELNKFHSGDLLTRLTSDIEVIVDTIVSTIPSTVALGVQLVGAFFVLYFMDPLLSILAFFLTPMIILFSRTWAKKLKGYHKDMQHKEGIYRSYMQESIQHMTIVKAFQLETHTLSLIDQMQKDRLKVVLKKNNLSIWVNLVLESGYWTGYIIAFVWGAFRLANSMITVGTFTAFIQLVEQVQSPFFGMVYILPQFISAKGSMERLEELDILDREFVGSTQCSELVGFKLNHVDFGYEGEDQVLMDVTMCVAPHEIVALVGPSGEGKTTIVRLLLALIKPTQGEVSLVDDLGAQIPINASTRQFMTYVPQGNTLFSGTIEDNLKVADQAASQDALVEALIQADAWSFVQELPEGLQTFLGEDGMGLSEGQAQRIAIARALLRKAPILILDEATSALDMDAEERILKAIHEDQFKRTCLIITHRPSALRICTKVYRLSNGSIALV